MDINQAIRSHASQPLTHGLILSLLQEYKRPNDKVHDLLDAGALQSIRRGLYIAGPSLHTNKPEPFLLANHISGPSYVSSDSALSYYGLIPERVYETTSMTTKASRKFVTPMGVFSYTHLSLPYYAFGLRQERVAEEQNVMIASPEKALFDKIITTRGIMLRSKKDAASYLIDDLRIDEDDLKQLNTAMMESWITDASKKKVYSWLLK